MKKVFGQKLMYVILSVLLFAAFGCSKLQVPVLTCTIGDQEYTSALVIANHGEVFSGQNGFLIMASDEYALSDGQYLGILIRGDQVGRYDLNVSLDNGKTQCAVIYQPKGQTDSSVVYAGTSGYVEITEVDFDHYRISGKFEFTMVNGDNEKLEIKSGEFKNLVFTNVSLADLASFDK